MSPLSSSHMASSGARADRLRRWLQPRTEPRLRYVHAVAAIALTTAVSGVLFPHVDLANLIMVYLLAVVVVAARLGLGPSVLAALGGVATFVWFFVPHYHSLVLADLEYLPTFVIMLVVGMLVATLTSRLRAQVLATEAREGQSLALYELSRELAAADQRRTMVDVVGHHLHRAFHVDALLLEHRSGEWLCIGAEVRQTADTEDARGATLAAREHRGVTAGPHLFLPLIVTNELVGALRLRQHPGHPLPAGGDRQLLTAFAHNIAVAMHRLMVGEQAQAARQRADQERMRNVLLSSVSHDLRTPLASITGSVTTLIDSGERLDAATRLDLMLSIRDCADALEHQVRDLLDLTRLESGTVAARREWHPVDEVVGGAMTRVERLLGDRPVAIDLPADLPLVSVDAALVELLLVNLLENAVHHTPAGTEISLAARLQDGGLTLEVADRGPGIAAADRAHVFDKFWRGGGNRHSRGSGLGLAICRAITDLHGGSIAVHDRDGGGARFVVDLPSPSMTTAPTPAGQPALEP